MSHKNYPKDVENILSEVVSKIPGAELFVSGGESVFLHGYQGETRCDYSLGVRIKDDRSLLFSETFEYDSFGDDPGRGYVYNLIVAGSQFDDFLKLLADTCQREVTQEGAQSNELLMELLAQLVHEGLLAVPQIGQRNVNLLADWLDEANIVYSEPRLVF